MKGQKIYTFKDKSIWAVDGLGIRVNDEEPIEIQDFQFATNEEFDEIKKNPKDQKIIKKVRDRIKKDKEENEAS